MPPSPLLAHRLSCRPQAGPRPQCGETPFPPTLSPAELQTSSRSSAARNTESLCTAMAREAVSNDPLSTSSQLSFSCRAEGVHADR